MVYPRTNSKRKKSRRPLLAGDSIIMCRRKIRLHMSKTVDVMLEALELRVNIWVLSIALAMLSISQVRLQ